MIENTDEDDFHFALLVVGKEEPGSGVWWPVSPDVKSVKMSPTSSLLSLSSPSIVVTIQDHHDHQPTHPNHDIQPIL